MEKNCVTHVEVGVCFCDVINHCVCVTLLSWGETCDISRYTSSNLSHRQCYKKIHTVIYRWRIAKKDVKRNCNSPSHRHYLSFHTSLYNSYSSRQTHCRKTGVTVQSDVKFDSNAGNCSESISLRIQK